MNAAGHISTGEPGFARRAVIRLATIELWERFSYYILMTLLPLFLTAPAAAGGFGWDGARALRLYGAYMACVTIAPLFGGIVSDRWLGSIRALRGGAVLMLAGHLLMAAPAFVADPHRATLLFLAALALVACGNGLFKPNISVLVGRLPHADAAARDAAFGTFWLFINIGGLAAGLAGGLIADRIGWHWAFATAGGGMIVALVLIAVNERRYIIPFAGRGAPGWVRPRYRGLDWSFVVPIGAVLGFAMLFGIAYFQTAGAISLFAQTSVDHRLFGIRFPAVWLIQLNPLFMMLVMPPLSRGWRSGRGIGAHWSTSRKMAAGFVLIALCFVLILGAIAQARHGLASPLWIAGGIFLLTCAELMTGPIALAAVSRLAPPAAANLAMGAFSAALGLGGLASGEVGALAVQLGYGPVFAVIVIVSFAGAGAMLLLGRWFARYGC